MSAYSAAEVKKIFSAINFAVVSSDTKKKKITSCHDVKQHYREAKVWKSFPGSKVCRFVACHGWCVFISCQGESVYWGCVCVCVGGGSNHAFDLNKVQVFSWKRDFKAQ